jgi:SAM-dependent methyltransferase
VGDPNGSPSVKTSGVPAAPGTWEAEAENWVRWARTPGHDVYWEYAPGFFDQIVPAPGRGTLEVGCGEGRVARDLAARGHTVTAVDSSPTLLRHAHTADPRGTYLLADAADLPFADDSFDIVVAYNSLMDIDDLDGAVAEAGRVLEPGGVLCVCVTHPLNDAGAFATADADAQFVIGDSYLGRRRFDATFERDGLTMTFHGWSYPLAAYTAAMEAARFAIDRVREPETPASLVDRDPSLARWRRVPMFLWFRGVAATG